MKIAIIEDRMSRLQQFVEFDLKNNTIVQIITGVDFDELLINLEKKIINILDVYHCIAFHRSAVSNQIRDTIKEYCQKNKKPLIFFSGGITSSTFQDKDFPFLHINSKLFYSINLKLFIDNCEQNNSINLLILQFGQKWKLSLFLHLRNNIIIVQHKKTIKRISDLQINSFIKTDITNSLDEQTKNIFMTNDYATITTEDIKKIKDVINNLTNEILYEETFNT